MKKQVRPYKFLQHLIVVFGIFIMLPTVTLAQDNSREQIAGRIANIDEKMRRFTYEKEAIGLEFEEISNFSMKARPILLGYNQIVEAIKLKENEKQSLYFLWEQEEKRKWDGEYQSLIAQRDNYLKQFRNSGGITSCFGVQCNTIEKLQNEYTRTVNYYKDRKKEYDDIALKLGNLNNERHNLTAELEYMGSVAQRILDLQGCWNLRTGKYISQIGVYSDLDNIIFTGYLEVNNLNNYQTGQTMFRVSRVDGRTFRGKEYTYSVDNNGNTIQKEIPVKITINSDGNFLTWTSDETVNMQRCN